ncbi:MAG TPA: acyl-ACP--UDP-N-acetylglucosamine O-acyltransferase [Candidatus Sumerlaeota bacterium]|nr:acyl-ACP--UDP-N-acetylglucosamine O-acyltransferase [Candidatus Sumerlaeota bacterium]
MTPDEQPLVHPTAVVDPSAQLAPGVEIGPYALVGPGVVLGAGCKVAGHAVIHSRTVLGERNLVFHYAVLGSDSQDLKFRGESTGLTIGDGNVFREFVTVNRATGDNKVTRIGNGNLFLAYTHVAHNCEVGNGVVLANSTQLAGEVVVEDYVTTGGLVGVHQFSRIGAYSFVGACSKVTQDILPFVCADGHPARPHGLNLVGLHRRGVSDERLHRIKDAYREIFLHGQRLRDALEKLEARYPGDPDVLRIAQFAHASTRGLARPRDFEGDVDKLAGNGGEE